MNDCPSLEMLADLSTGKIQGEERQRLLAHVATCATCKEHILRTERLQAVLTASSEEADGGISVKIPSMRPGFSEKLTASVLAEFTRQKDGALRRAAFKDVVARLTATFLMPPAPATGLAYQTAPDATDDGPTMKTIAEIEAALVSMFEFVLDPNLPTDERLKRIRAVSEFIEAFSKRPD